MWQAGRPLLSSCRASGRRGDTARVTMLLSSAISSRALRIYYACSRPRYVVAIVTLSSPPSLAPPSPRRTARARPPPSRQSPPLPPHRPRVDRLTRLSATIPRPPHAPTSVTVLGCGIPFYNISLYIHKCLSPRYLRYSYPYLNQPPPPTFLFRFLLLSSRGFTTLSHLFMAAQNPTHTYTPSRCLLLLYSLHLRLYQYV